MLVLLIAVLFGLATGYFATQNTMPVTIRVVEYVWEGIPLYMVVMGSLLVGLFIAWILYVARSVSSTVTFYTKEYAVKGTRQMAADLEKRLRALEEENTRLRARLPTAAPSPSEGRL